MATAASLDSRGRIAAASLVIGPLLMSAGDLFHPPESWDSTEQIRILSAHAAHWYAAHLLLFIGMLVSIPGLLALAGLTAERNAGAGFAARILILIGAASFTSIFVGEMLIGRFLADGAGDAAATTLLNTMFSTPMAAAVMPGALAFFVGAGIFAGPLLRAGGTRRVVAACYASGTLAIFAEIVSAQVILSKIGNILIFCGGVIAAALIVTEATARSSSSTT